MADKSSSPHGSHLHYHHNNRGMILRIAPFILFFLFILFVAPFFKFSLNPFKNTIPYDDLKQRLAVDGHADDGGKAGCDLFNGTWVRDEEELRYTNRTCRTLPESNNCVKYGKDQDFVNWRWRPDGCELPRFDAMEFLSIVRGKRLAFVGDSVARNQMESLLCLLSQVETPQNVHKDAGERFRTWYFPSHDFTLSTLWTRFLVEGTERVINGSASGFYDLHLDKIDIKWTENVSGINYIVISDGHWFFRKNYLYEGGKLIGCVFCSEANLTDHGVIFAVRRALRTSLHFLNKCEDCEGLLTLMRTFSPSHFEGGSWNGGGYCNRTRPSNEGGVSFSGTDWDLRNAQVDELERVQAEERRGMKWFGLLDVTKAMMMRADAHPGSYWNNEWNRGFNDCVHWCMPGPIDVWNDMLLALLRKDALRN